MQAAGAAVADAIAARWSSRPIRVLCGPGNNGGDGFVTASRLQSAGWLVTVALLGSPEALSGDAAQVASLWRGTVEPFSDEGLDNAGLVVDAIFGAGLSRPLEETALKQINALQNSAIPVCAIDIPSGVDGTTGNVLGSIASADLTVTFFRKKPGHLLYPGRRHCGEIELADIRILESLLPDNDYKTWENDPLL